MCVSLCIATPVTGLQRANFSYLKLADDGKILEVKEKPPGEDHFHVPKSCMGASTLVPFT